jgi:hypothetical protein
MTFKRRVLVQNRLRAKAAALIEAAAAMFESAPA